MPVAVIDRLEVVEVDEEDRQPILGSAVGVARGQALVEQAPIREGCEGVIERLTTEQLHQRIALEEAFAELAHGVAQPGDDEAADQHAADHVWHRIDGSTGERLDRQRGRVDQQRGGKGDDSAPADGPEFGVLAIGREGHRRMQRGGTHKGDRRELGQNERRRQGGVPDMITKHVEDRDGVRGEHEQDEQAGRRTVRPIEEPQPGDHRDSNQRGVEEGSGRRALTAVDDVRGDAKCPDQHPDTRGEDRCVKVRTAFATRDTTPDKDREAGEAGDIAETRQCLANVGHQADLGNDPDPDRAEQHAYGDELPRSRPGRMMHPYPDEDRGRGREAHAGDERLDDLLDADERRPDTDPEPDDQVDEPRSPTQ